MNAPQIIVIVLLSLGVGISIARNGEDHEQPISFGWTLLRSVILAAILWWGGFWG
jgi:hypothetical protein